MSILRPARAVLGERQELFAGLEVALPDPRVWSNASAAGGAAFGRWLHWCNAARHVRQPNVVLGRYPAGALLSGRGPHDLLIEDALVREQAFAPADQLPAIAAGLRAATDALVVDRPVLLACHPGAWTWGHWLLETLPKIVLAERAAAHRFTFAVPAEVVADPGNPYCAAVLDSLAAYGIAPARLLRVRTDAVYRFESLFDVAGVVERPGLPGLIQPHPGVLGVMRDSVAVEEDGPDVALTAFMRRPGDARPLANAAQIRAALAQVGAVVIEPGVTRFADQVALARRAQVIVGELGSNLAAMIYARPGTGVVSLASAAWRDLYFTGLDRACGVLRADVRGAALPGPQADPAVDAFLIRPVDLGEALDAMVAAQANPRPRLPRDVDGRRIARLTGRAVARVQCGFDGDLDALPREGFGAAEPTGAWVLAPVAKLRLPDFVPPGVPLWLEIDGAGFVAPPRFVSRPLEVWVNGQKVGAYEIDKETHLTVHLTPAVLGDGPGIEIEFRTGVSVSPKAMGVSEDGRKLGFFLREIALRRPAG